jgi:predicted lipid-binding transport protein (Tim44 family)
MTRLNRILLTASVAVTLLFAGPELAFAKRMGGGKSFGGRPSYSESYKSPGRSLNNSSAQQPSGYRSPAAQHNQAARDTLARRGGLMGMLGGLALGGLLGAMLFGGAFEHINFLDILIFGAIAFMLFKWMAARRPGAPDQATAGGVGQGYRPQPASSHEPVVERQAEVAYSGGAQRAAFDTDILSRKGRPLGQGAAYTPSEPSDVPADFDREAFLTGAKAAYAHLQEAWDAADLAELRGLTTDKVFGELQEQLRERSGDNRTELLDVAATLLAVRDLGNDRLASVLFDVRMREAPEDEPVRVTEVWHFVRGRTSKQPTWFLDGIQQMDDDN